MSDGRRTTADVARGESQHGRLVTIKSDGRPQLSNVNHTFDPATGCCASRSRPTGPRPATSPATRARAITSRATTSGTTPSPTARPNSRPVAADPHDDTVEELIEVYRAIDGEHPDWDDYRAAMVRDKRLVVRLSVEHLYGQA